MVIYYLIHPPSDPIPNVTKLSCIQTHRVFSLCFAWCPCKAINVSVQFNGGFLPDMTLLTLCYYHRGTRSNAMKRFCICSLLCSHLLNYLNVTQKVWMRSDFNLYTRTDSVMNGTHDSARLVICDITNRACYVIIVKLQNGGDRRGAGSVSLIACCRSKIEDCHNNVNNSHTSRAKGTKVTTKKLGRKHIVAEK